jgi:hypothetical protein
VSLRNRLDDLERDDTIVICDVCPTCGAAIPRTAGDVYEGLLRIWEPCTEHRPASPPHRDDVTIQRSYGLRF